MVFDHEKLDVYRLAVRFSSWVGERLEGSLKNSRTSATKHLDEASGSITNNIAEGNGKRSRTDRCRFLDIARCSALECAARLDTLVARKRMDPIEAEEGKQLLERVENDVLAHDRRPVLASGPRHENTYEHDDDCESEHEHEREREWSAIVAGGAGRIDGAAHRPSVCTTSRRLSG
jgi:four helix bundle protein